jgi:hypothetical protein
MLLQVRKLEDRTTAHNLLQLVKGPLLSSQNILVGYPLRIRYVKDRAISAKFGINL